MSNNKMYVRDEFTSAITKRRYKPGQLLTINHKVYRVKRKEHNRCACLSCDARKECFDLDVFDLLCYDTQVDCYLQLVTPNSLMG